MRNKFDNLADRRESLNRNRNILIKQDRYITIAPDTYTQAFIQIWQSASVMERYVHLYNLSTLLDEGNYTVTIHYAYPHPIVGTTHAKFEFDIIDRFRWAMSHPLPKSANIYRVELYKRAPYGVNALSFMLISQEYYTICDIATKLTRK